jgi:GNAT superfamily N-acetyltransferase
MPCVSRVIRATPADIPAWRELAREVEPLFGAPMADDPRFLHDLGSSIAENRAFCVRGPNGKLLGGILRADPPPDHRISWLAVSKGARRQGTGHSLVTAALRGAPSGTVVRVVTFVEGDAAGSPARAFYRALGFEPDNHIAGPHGAPRQTWILTLYANAEGTTQAIAAQASSNSGEPRALFPPFRRHP